jgi:mannose-6-phosphate isomerase-like protein (cupin superfamily)
MEGFITRKNFKQRYMQRTIINPLYKDTITFLETSAETGHQYSLGELTLMPGGGNPPHYHTAFAETFIAVHGILGLELRDQQIFLRPGEDYTVPIGTVHNFFNPGKEEITFRVKFTPGHEGMEYALRIAYGMATDGLTDQKGMPRSLMAAAVIMELGNSYPTGLMSVFRPVLSFLARRAKRNGLEKTLIQKYCV